MICRKSIQLSREGTIFYFWYFIASALRSSKLSVKLIFSVLFGLLQNGLRQNLVQDLEDLAGELQRRVALLYFVRFQINSQMLTDVRGKVVNGIVG